MAMEKEKQLARLRILEKLRESGMPGLSDEPRAEEKEQSLNDWGISEGLAERMSGNIKKKKKRPVSPEGDEAIPPTVVTGQY